MRQLPTHSEHQEEAKEEEREPSDRVLDPNDLVVSRKHVFSPETLIMVMIVIRLVGVVSVFECSHTNKRR
jgi:cytoskeletal protein RodZ